jgi:hypothetical protein
MIGLLSAAGPLSAPQTGAEKYELVWSGNSAAVVGVLICCGLLAAWLEARDQRLHEEEEDTHRY